MPSRSASTPIPAQMSAKNQRRKKG
jgi:hypothetical protein